MILCGVYCDFIYFLSYICSSGFGAMGKTQSGCYGCQRYSYPVEIIPPFKRINRERRPRGRHSCTAQNCYNRATQHGKYVT